MFKPLSSSTTPESGRNGEVLNSIGMHVVPASAIKAVYISQNHITKYTKLEEWPNVHPVYQERMTHETSLLVAKGPC